VVGGGGGAHGGAGRGGWRRKRSGEGKGEEEAAELRNDCQTGGQGKASEETAAAERNCRPPACVLLARSGLLLRCVFACVVPTAAWSGPVAVVWP
jgi:hypothetical protein